MSQETEKGVGSSTLLRVLRSHFDSVLAIAKRIEPAGGGGYLCVANEDTGAPLFIFECGEIPEEKAAKRRAFAEEKASRLASHPMDITSWQSRDPDQERWGGAIRCKSCILSFSGFSAYMDEAMMMELAIRMGLLTVKDANAIAALTQNIVWGKFGH